MTRPTFLRDLGLMAAAAAAGWWAHTPRTTVHAADGADAPFFQFSNVAGEATLSIYSATDHTIYVYGGVLSGNSRKQCTYSIKLGRAGAPLDRTNCPMGSLF